MKKVRVHERNHRKSSCDEFEQENISANLINNQIMPSISQVAVEKVNPPVVSDCLLDKSKPNSVLKSDE